MMCDLPQLTLGYSGLAGDTLRPELASATKETHFAKMTSLPYSAVLGSNLHNVNC